MYILRYTRRAFSLIGYLSNEKITSFVIMLLLVFTEAGSITYVVFHWQIEDYENCLHAGLQVVALLPAVVSLCSMWYHRYEMRDIIDGFQRICESCKICSHKLGNVL